MLSKNLEAVHIQHGIVDKGLFHKRCHQHHHSFEPEVIFYPPQGIARFFFKEPVLNFIAYPAGSVIQMILFREPFETDGFRDDQLTLPARIDQLGAGTFFSGFTFQVCDALESGLPLLQAVSIAEKFYDPVAREPDPDFSGVFHVGYASDAITNLCYNCLLPYSGELPEFPPIFCP